MYVDMGCCMHVFLWEIQLPRKKQIDEVGDRFRWKAASLEHVFIIRCKCLRVRVSKSHIKRPIVFV